MNNKHFFSLIFFVLTFFSCHISLWAQQKPINVLFVGNSFTYYNDMPDILQKIMDSEGLPYKIEQITFPGTSLDRHLTEMIKSKSTNSISTRTKKADEKTETEIKLSEKKWDIVIFQTGTVQLLIPEAVEFKVNVAIQKMKKIVDNEDAKFYFFQTWTSKCEYPKNYCYPSSEVDYTIQKLECCSKTFSSKGEELAEIVKVTKEIAAKNQIFVTDNAERFYELNKEYGIELFEDRMHPSRVGAYFNACIFYRILTHRNPEKIKYNVGIEPKTWRVLKHEAK